MFTSRIYLIQQTAWTRVRYNLSVKAIITNKCVKELTLFALGYLIYILLKQLFTEDLETIAIDNAEHVIGIEKALYIYWEPSLQQWLLENAVWAVTLSNWVYTVGFLPVLIPAAIILFLLRYKTYAYYRNIFLMTFAITWFLYLTFPVAPPRLMLEEGFIDSIEVMGPAIYNSKQSLSYYNQFSAMPSMHFGWILLFSVIFMKNSYWPLKVFGAIYPLLALAAIVITANHYFFDALVGGIIISGCYGLYVLKQRLPGGYFMQFKSEPLG